MSTKIKYLGLGSVTLFALLAFLGISRTATADYGFHNDRQLFSAICQSAPTGFSMGAYNLCNEPGNDGATPYILVPTEKHECFYLTDFSAYNNNGDREVDFRDGNGGSRAFAATVVVASQYDGKGPTLSSQNWHTPLVFHNDLYVDVHNPNNNIIITVSGFYDKCP